MNDLIFSFKDNKIIIYNNINPHLQKESVYFLDRINQQFLQQIIQENIIDTVYYYMQENNLLED